MLSVYHRPQWLKAGIPFQGLPTQVVVSPISKEAHSFRVNADVVKMVKTSLSVAGQKPLKFYILFLAPLHDTKPCVVSCRPCINSCRGTLLFLRSLTLCLCIRLRKKLQAKLLFSLIMKISMHGVSSICDDH